MYSTDSDATKEFCERYGFNFEIGFVKTQKCGDKVYVSATTGKPQEWIALRAACDGKKYVYKGLMDL